MTSRKLIKMIANMTTEEEIGNAEPSEGASSVLDQLIVFARELAAVPDCHRCQENKPGAFTFQTYTVDDDKLGIHLMINVTAAYDFARRYLVPTEIPKKYHNHLMLINMSETFCGAHVEHVDRTKPAIMGMRDGRIMLMDGTHRLFAWIKHGEPPVAYCLNEKQTAQFIMKETKL